jgi:hypothetical protein
MNRSIFEKFINKYNLSGACESVTLVATDNDLSVRAISSDKNVLSEVVLKHNVLPFNRYSIYDTNRLKSMIGILGDEIKVLLAFNHDIVHAINFVDDANTEVTFVLSDESIIPKAPDLKKMPKFELKIDLDETFINTFVKAKGALMESETFSVSVKNENTDIILGYSTSNTNRIKIRVKSNKIDSFDSISFSSEYFKNILLANKEISGGVVEVSSSGLARITFESNDVKSVYYLVQIVTTN